MKTGWTVEVYLSSELPLTDKVPSVIRLSFLVVSDDKPSEDLIAALTSSHTRNCTLLMAEVSQIQIPNELL